MKETEPKQTLSKEEQLLKRDEVEWMLQTGIDFFLQNVTDITEYDANEWISYR